ncbi:hypothetical protein H5410_027905 [Solanum commersonii]|uniref:Uncharacterized protein n=1 Tax=Solanum commersonii TaxID=4109 RepID=A0A9J5Z2I6_SOLCO|nr:hypothetical protein H5410_027905 [Solanum commersonii]
MIFLLENSEIQRKEEPWKIFQRYLLNGLYFPGESYKTRLEYFLNDRKVFNKVLYYNNERHKHTWFIKVCAKIFANSIPNWFLNWWSYHGPTIKILSEPFLKLYREWVKIHKWALEVDFTEEQIPCLYRTYFNNFWDKLMKRDPQTKSLYGQELIDLISKTIQDYKSIPHKGIIAETKNEEK